MSSANVVRLSVTGSNVSELLKRREALAAEARKMFELQYPPVTHPHLLFDDAMWDLRPQIRPRSLHAQACRFLRLGSNTELLPPAFADLIKTYMILDDRSFQVIHRLVMASRYLFEAIVRRTGGIFLSTTWDDLRAADFETAEQMILSMHYKRPEHLTRSLDKLLTWIDDNRLCPAVTWRPITRESQGDPTARLALLPTPEALEGLAIIYRTLAIEPTDRLFICAVGLMLLTGCRVSEIASLPHDCLINEFHKGKHRYGIRYWNRKSKGGPWGAAVRWLSPLGAELAIDLVREAQSLTGEARVRAQELESDPSRVRIPWAVTSKTLTLQEVARVFGIGTLAVYNARLYPGTTRWRRLLGDALREAPRKLRYGLERAVPIRTLRTLAELGHGRPYGAVPPDLSDDTPVTLKDAAKYLGIPLGTLRGRVHHGIHRGVNYEEAMPLRYSSSEYSKAGIELALLAKRGPLHSFILNNGENQALSSTLFIAFQGWNMTRPTSGEVPLLVAMNRTDISMWLCGHPTSTRPKPGVFERLGLGSAAGTPGAKATPIILRPHSLRHWLNTVAHKAGMSAVQITTWMQRRDPQQTMAYIHSLADMTDLTREGLRTGTLVGGRQRTYASLEPSERDSYLAAMPAVHQLEHGACSLPTSPEDCTTAKYCELCHWFLHRPSNPGEVAALEARRANFSRALGHVAQVQATGAVVEQRLVTLFEQSLCALDSLLSATPGHDGDGATLS